MALDVVHAGTQRGERGNRRREQLSQSDVLMTGAEFRKQLGWGKDRFFAAVKAGRFRDLISLNASSPRRPVYVRAKVEAFLSESPSLTLRASQRHTR